jgi:hypothetical protein
MVYPIEMENPSIQIYGWCIYLWIFMDGFMENPMNGWCRKWKMDGFFSVPQARWRVYLMDPKITWITCSTPISTSILEAEDSTIPTFLHIIC